MTHISTAELAEMAQVKKRQIQRLLEKHGKRLGATKTDGGHWLIPNSARVRNWAKNHKPWQRDARKSRKPSKSINPSDNSVKMVTIEGISLMFDMWLRKVGNKIPCWDETQIKQAMALLDLQAGTYEYLAKRLQELQQQRSPKSGAK